MTNLKALRIVGGLLPLLMVAAGPVDAPTSDVLTLISPNEQAYGKFGWDVAAAGDVNQDGFADSIVAAPEEDTGLQDAGHVYVISGGDDSLIFDLTSPNEEGYGWFGSSIASSGDVNQDGFADVIVGARQEDPGASPSDAGRAYVFSGQDGSLLFELASPNERSNGNFGYSVAGAGDVNQDGSPDVLVGAWQEGTRQEGRAYVFSGQKGGLLFELVSPNEEAAGRFGQSVAGSGDVNRDGVADVLVGAGTENPGNSPLQAGRAYVFSGQDASLLLELVSPNEQDSGVFGESVAGAGDVNQDGFSDVIVSARLEEADDGPPAAGRAYMLSGKDGSLLLELVSPNEEGNGWFGNSVASAGDINQDGVPDVIVGAIREGSDDPHLQGWGRAYVFSGADGRVLSEHASPNESDENTPGEFGVSVAGAGDVNQDGLPDVIVGAWQESPGDSPPYAGRAYIFLSPGAARINSGGPNYTDTNGSLFVADRAYAPGSFGYVGGLEHRFNQPIGGTDDDPLYQDVRIAREGDADGIFAYRFDVAAPARYDVTLYLMAPDLDGPGDVVMDVKAEEDVIFDDLDVTAEAGGEYQALVKTFAVDVSDGTLDLRFRAVNKAAVVSAIAVVAQAEVHGSGVARRTSGGQ